MARNFLPTLLILPTLVLACSASSGDDDDYYSETESGNQATPVATAPPESGYYMSTLVLEENDGVDLDGDGRVDNNYDDILADLADTISSGFLNACQTALGGVELPDDAPVDDADALCRIISGTLEAALQNFVSVDAFNINIVEAFDLGAIYLVTTDSDDTRTTVDYYWGTGEGSTYYTSELIGSQSGTLDAAGNGEFGTSDFSIAMELGDPSLVYMHLIKSRTEAKFSSNGISNSMLGGVMTEEAFIDALMVSLSNNAPVPEEVLGPISTVLAQLVPDCGEEDTAMEDCDEDLGGISMGYSYTTESVVVLPGDEATPTP